MALLHMAGVSGADPLWSAYPWMTLILRRYISKSYADIWCHMTAIMLLDKRPSIVSSTMKYEARYSCRIEKKHRKSLFALHYSMETVWENFCGWSEWKSIPIIEIKVHKFLFSSSTPTFEYILGCFELLNITVTHLTYESLGRWEMVILTLFSWHKWLSDFLCVYYAGS